MPDKRKLYNDTRPRIESFVSVWKRAFGNFQSHFIEGGYRSQIVSRNKMNKKVRKHPRLTRSSKMTKHTWADFYASVDNVVLRLTNLSEEEFRRLITHHNETRADELRYQKLYENLREVYIELRMLGYSDNDLQAQRICSSGPDME